MSLIKIKQGNATIAIISGIMSLILLTLALQAFGIVPATLVILTPIGAGLITIIFGIWLFTETFFEGPKPKISKDRSAQVNLGMSIILVIFGIIIMIGRPTITPVFRGVLGFVYAITLIFLLRELFVD